MNDKLIYLDNAATTKIAQEVLDAMQPYLTDYYGNPSTGYRLGTRNSDAIDKARSQIASLINADPDEIYFTSGGSESDNWALKGIAESLKKKGNHIITTHIEHHAVLNTAKWLESQGYEVTYLPVDSYGFISIDDLRNAIKPTTILVSVMHANNEIGTIEPIRRIGTIVHEHGILFHTDAVQSFGHIHIDVEDCHIDLLSASGHKLNAPKGIGCLYIRRGTEIAPLIHGGAQEKGMRAGTENVPGIVGFGQAAERAGRLMKAHSDKENELRNYLINKVLDEIPESRLNGANFARLPNNANFSFKGVDGSAITMALELDDICCSAGAACTSSSFDPSHVIRAIQVPDEYALGTVRFSLNEDITKKDIDYVVECLKTAIEVQLSI